MLSFTECKTVLTPNKLTQLIPKLTPCCLLVHEVETCAIRVTDIRKSDANNSKESLLDSDHHSENYV